MNVDKYISGSAALFGAFLSWFTGGLDVGLAVLALFMVIDQITGGMKGFILKKWSSKIGFHGIAKKVCMCLFVGIADILYNEGLNERFMSWRNKQLVSKNEPEPDDI